MQGGAESGQGWTNVTSSRQAHRHFNSNSVRETPGSGGLKDRRDGRNRRPVPSTGRTGAREPSPRSARSQEGGRKGEVSHEAPVRHPALEAGLGDDVATLGDAVAEAVKNVAGLDGAAPRRTQPPATWAALVGARPARNWVAPATDGGDAGAAENQSIVETGRHTQPDSSPVAKDLVADGGAGAERAAPNAAWQGGDTAGPTAAVDEGVERTDELASLSWGESKDCDDIGAPNCVRNVEVLEGDGAGVALQPSNAPVGNSHSDHSDGLEMEVAAPPPAAVLPRMADTGMEYTSSARAVARAHPGIGGALRAGRPGVGYAAPPIHVPHHPSALPGRVQHAAGPLGWHGAPVGPGQMFWNAHHAMLLGMQGFPLGPGAPFHEALPPPMVAGLVLPPRYVGLTPLPPGTMMPVSTPAPPAPLLVPCCFLDARAPKQRFADPCDALDVGQPSPHVHDASHDTRPLPPHVPVAVVASMPAPAAGVADAPADNFPEPSASPGGGMSAAVASAPDGTVPAASGSVQGANPPASPSRSRGTWAELARGAAGKPGSTSRVQRSPAVPAPRREFDAVRTVERCTPNQLTSSSEGANRDVASPTRTAAVGQDDAVCDAAGGDDEGFWDAQAEPHAPDGELEHADAGAYCDGSALARLRALCQNPQGILTVAGARFKPRGVTNPGNLCFMSASLQAMLASSGFSHMLRTLRDARGELAPEGMPVLQGMADFAAAYDEDGAARSLPAAHGPRAEGSTHSPGRTDGQHGVRTQLAGMPLLPTMLLELVSKFVPEEGIGHGLECQQQHDAQEFVTFLVDTMHQELQQLARLYGWQDEQGGVVSPSSSAGDGWLTQSGRRSVRRQEVGKGTAEVHTAASSLFRGVMASSVAASGTTTSITLQPFTGLGLHIARSTVRTVEDAIDDLTDAEIIPGYRPPNQASRVTATKTLRIESLPPMLVLHLMRFDFGIMGSTKIERHIAYGTNLSMRSHWLTPRSKDRKATYNLVATVTHHGSAVTAGHYTANVLQPDGRWLHFDDGDIMAINESSVLAGYPYILFYRRT